MTDAFAVIRPFLQPIAGLLDSDCSEIMVNGNQVFFEQNGKVEKYDCTINEAHLLFAVRQIARRLGDDISEAQPILDSRLPDGSRVAAVLPPASVNGVSLTIRKFRQQSFRLEELVSFGSITVNQAESLTDSVAKRRNILISGATGSGKTSLLNVLAGLIPHDQRIVIIEDTAEIRLDHPNKLNFEAKRPINGNPGVSIRELVKAAMRHRPDRIIIGECRGKEAYDMLMALNSGHSGSAVTTHADSCVKALEKLTMYAAMAEELPWVALQHMVAQSIDVVVQLQRINGRRVVTEVKRVVGFETAFQLEDL